MDRRIARCLLVLVVVVGFPLGPWVDDGAAPCDDHPPRCFEQAPPAGLVADCYSAITTDLATVVARCTATLSPMQVVGGGAVADSDSLGLSPNAAGSVEISVTRHGGGNTTVNYTFMVDPTVAGIVWDVSDLNFTGSIPPGDSAARTHVAPFHVAPNPAVTDVVITHVYWDQTGGAKDYIAFNVLRVSTPAGGLVFGLAALAVGLVLARRGRD